MPCCGARQVAVPEGESKEGAQAEATKRFNDINLELSDLSTNFSNNLLDSTAAFKRLITDKAGVAGLPASFLGQAAQKVHGSLSCGPMQCRGQALKRQAVTWDGPLFAHAGCEGGVCWCICGHRSMDGGIGSAILHGNYDLRRQQVRCLSCARQGLCMHDGQ